MSTLPHTKPGEVRAAAHANMSPAEKTKLRTQMLSKLDDLPQRRFINDVDAEIWVDSVIAREPERAWWHYERLFGIGGSEIGVFLGAEEGLFHPFTDQKAIAEAKLLKKPLEATNGDMQRGTALEPTAQNLYRSRVIARGGIAREDLMEQMKGYHDPEHPWLVGNPDDIVEEKGKVYIVDYKVPMPDQIAHYDHDGIPFYYAAQLHHYRLIAAKCGIHIDGLRLCSLDLKKWNIDERPLAYSQELTDAIVATGDKYWFQHIMQGDLPPRQVLRKSASLEDLDIEEVYYAEADLTQGGAKGTPVYLLDEAGERVVTRKDGKKIKEELAVLAGVYNSWSQATLAADTRRDMAQNVLSDRLPVSVFPDGMDRINLGVANLVVKRAYKEEAVVEAITNLLTRAGMDPDKVESILGSENFWTDPVYASDKLIELVRMHLDVDIRTDPRFESALAVPSQRRMDTSIDLLRSLDVNKEVDFSALVDEHQSSVRMELVREPLSGPFNELKQEFRGRFLSALQPTVNTASYEYAQRRGILVEERRVLDAQAAEAKARAKAEREEARAETARQREVARQAREAKAAKNAPTAPGAPAPAPRRRRSGP